MVPHPFAADELFEIFFLERIAAVGMQRVDRRHGEDRADPERHRGRVPHFDTCGVQRVWQLLAAPVGGRGEPVPAGCRPGGVGLLPAGRGGDVAVLEWRTKFVAHTVEGRDYIAGKAAGFRQHRIDRFLVEVAIKAFCQCGFQAGGVFKRKRDVGNRSAVAHGPLI